MKWFAGIFVVMFATLFLIAGIVPALIAGAGLAACSAIAWDRGNDSNKAIGRRGGY